MVQLITMRTGRPKWLDRKECFDLWCELGTVRKVQLNLARKGIVNPTTKNPPSDSGVRFAAYKYVLYNPGIARKEYMKLGEFLDGEEKRWFDHLDGWARAILITRRDRYEDWKKWIEPYKKKILVN